MRKFVIRAVVQGFAYSVVHAETEAEAVDEFWLNATTTDSDVSFTGEYFVEEKELRDE